MSQSLGLGSCTKNQVKNVEKSNSKSVKQCKDHPGSQDSEIVIYDSYGTASESNRDKKYKTRVIYNSKVDKATVEASLACKGKSFKPLMTKTHVKTKIFASRDKTVCAIAQSNKGPDIIVNSQVTATSQIPKDAMLGQKQDVVENPAGEREVGNPRRRVSVNTAQSAVDTCQQSNLQACPIYDVNLAGIEDKFTSALYNVGTQGAKCEDQNNCPLFKQWQNQSQFQFGFIPLEEQVMPDNSVVGCSDGLSPFNIHALIRATNKPNYMEARLPVKSQLNVSEWKSRLTQYWDQQLLQLIEFGFPLDFNRNCPLRREGSNHSSAVDYPSDVDDYIKEETELLSPR